MYASTHYLRRYWHFNYVVYGTYMHSC